MTPGPSNYYCNPQTDALRSRQLSLLRILGEQRGKLRINLFDHGDNNSSSGESLSISAQLLENRRELFESSLLGLLSNSLLDDQDVSFFPEDTVWELDYKLGCLLKVLNDAANQDIQCEAGPTGARVGDSGNDYPGLESMLSRTAASPGPFELATGSPISPFRLVSSPAAREANSLLRGLNWLLYDAQQQALHRIDRSTRYIATTSAAVGALPDVPGQIRAIECDFRDHIGSIFDTMSKDFQKCQSAAPDIFHRMLVRLLDVGSLESAFETQIEVILYCSKLGQWQPARCRSACKSAEPAQYCSALCEYLESASIRDEALLLEFHRALDAFACGDDEDALHACLAVTDPQRYPALADLINCHRVFDLHLPQDSKFQPFRFLERRALAAQLAWNLLICCGWHHTSKPWDSHEVRFRSSTPEQYEKERPYIACFVGSDAFDSTDISLTTPLEPANRRPVPAFTMFAKLLLELEYGPLPSGDFSAKNDYGYKLIKAFYQSKKMFGDSSRDAYLKAVGTCLQFDKLRAKQRGMPRSRHETDTETRRSLIRTHIVANIMQDLERLSQPSRKRPGRQPALEDEAHPLSGYQAPRPKHDQVHPELLETENKRRPGKSVQFSVVAGDTATQSIRRLDQPLRVATQPIFEKPTPHSAIAKVQTHDPLQTPLPTAASPEIRESHSPARPDSRDGFTIAFICALPLEADAITALFDHHWDPREYPPSDTNFDDQNAYSMGAIGRHAAVVIHMEGMGKANSATAAHHCRISFRKIKLAIVVGVCGAVPFPMTKGSDSEIVLGDVIISNSVVQYDLGKRHPNHFERNDTLRNSTIFPPRKIRNLLAKLETMEGKEQLEAEIVTHLRVIQQNPKLRAEYLGAEKDHLFDSSQLCCRGAQPLSLPANRIERGNDIEGQSRAPMANGDAQAPPLAGGILDAECGCKTASLPRTRLTCGQPVMPVVHIGPIASGDTVMRSKMDRDEIARREGVLGFEMEGAGLWDIFPYVVIKGVCDYADSHKGKSWQRYAAATAASCAKAFLNHWVPVEQPTG